MVKLTKKTIRYAIIGGSATVVIALALGLGLGLGLKNDNSNKFYSSEIANVTPSTTQDPGMAGFSLNQNFKDIAKIKGDSGNIPNDEYNLYLSTDNQNLANGVDITIGKNKDDAITVPEFMSETLNSKPISVTKSGIPIIITKAEEETDVAKYHYIFLVFAPGMTNNTVGIFFSPTNNFDETQNTGRIAFFSWENTINTNKGDFFISFK